MTEVRLTAAQARALGIDGGAPGENKEEIPVRRRTRRQLPRDRAISTCHNCGQVFTTDAAETRHVAETHHARYDTTL